MASINYPTGGKLMTRNYAEEPVSVVRRTEMENGPAKQAPTQSVQFNEFDQTWLYTAAEYAAWLTWFKSTAKNGSLWFNYVHPRTGSTVDARMVGGAFKAPTLNERLTHYYVTFRVETLL